MRKLAKKYLSGQLSRRDFVRMSTAAGFSIAAARSAAGALESVTRSPAASTRTFQGTGGELVAEQLRTMGTRFIFVCNSSGMGALSDAVVDRPDLQFIQAPRRVMAKLIADRCRLTALSLSTGLAMDVAMREVPPGLSS